MLMGRKNICPRVQDNLATPLQKVHAKGSVLALLVSFQSIMMKIIKQR